MPEATPFPGVASFELGPQTNTFTPSARVALHNRRCDTLKSLFTDSRRNAMAETALSGAELRNSCAVAAPRWAYF